VHHTFLQPAGTQQRAAELLNTYPPAHTVGISQPVSTSWRASCGRRRSAP